MLTRVEGAHAEMSDLSRARCDRCAIYVTNLVCDTVGSKSGEVMTKKTPALRTHTKARIKRDSGLPCQSIDCFCSVYPMLHLVTNAYTLTARVRESARATVRVSSVH